MDFAIIALQSIFEDSRNFKTIQITVNHVQLANLYIKKHFFLSIFVYRSIQMHLLRNIKN